MLRWSAGVLLVCLIGTGTPAWSADTPPCNPYRTDNTDGSTNVADGAFDDWKNLPQSGFVQIALIIGNDYQANGGTLNVPALNNPGRDASLVARLLAGRGYHVACLLNVGKDDIVQAVQQFRVAWENIREPAAPIGFVYFAGHGGETSTGEPFVLPADFDRFPQGGSGIQILPLYQFVAFLPDSRFNYPIVVIDACRQTVADQTLYGSATIHAFGASLTAFGQQNQSPKLHLVFSTGNGEVAQDGDAGKNGPFADALEQYLDQSPWSEPHAPWTRPPDPIVPDIVEQVADALGTKSQHPTELNSEDQDLWFVSPSASEPYYLWRYGRLSNVHVAEDNPCQLLADSVKGLDAVTPHADWVELARRRFLDAETVRHCAPNMVLASATAPASSPIARASADFAADAFAVPQFAAARALKHNWETMRGNFPKPRRRRSSVPRGRKPSAHCVGWLPSRAPRALPSSPRQFPAPIRGTREPTRIQKTQERSWRSILIRRPAPWRRTNTNDCPMFSTE